MAIFEIILRICMENIEFCGKRSKFYPKDVCLFSEKELNNYV